MTNTEIKKEAHRIRAAAAAKHGCDAKIICFIICWNMAKRGEKLPWETEMVEEIVINVVSDRYKGDPKKAKSYCWSDYETKVPGLDINRNGWEQEVLRLIESNNAKKAYVNCMWPSGYTGVYPKEKETQRPVVTVAAEKEAHGVGWCDLCGSYCFGDCQAN